MPHNRHHSYTFWPIHHTFDRTPIPWAERVGAVLFIGAAIAGAWMLLIGGMMLTH